jgi:antirestriction protein ArdC
MKLASLTPAADAFDLAESVWTAMVDGLAPWQKTWRGGEAPGLPQNVTTGRKYRSGNSIWLMMTATKFNFSSNWVSFLEATKLGGSLKGQKSFKIEVPIVKKTVDPVTGTEKERLIGWRKASVFNVDQVDGVVFPGATPRNLIESVEAVDRMLAKLQSQGLSYVEPSENGGCWYLPAEDRIGMPNRSAFNDTYEFYSSLCHEMAHATSKDGRVPREPVSYAYEEMRAEIAATLVCCTLDLPRSQKQVDNHAAYLKDWLEEFSDKKEMLLKAASEAQAIHDYLIALASE